MSDSEVAEKPFAAEIAKQGRAACKKCKEKCQQNELRIAKLVPSPYGGGKMKAWHHLSCLFETFKKQRATTKRLEDPHEDIDGWDSLSADHQQLLLDQIVESNKFFEQKFGIKPKEPTPKPNKSPKTDALPNTSEPKLESAHKDNLFKEFRRLVANITNVSAYLEKTELVRTMFTKGSDGTGFKGDLTLWCRLLLPGVVKRVYNLQSKQLVKLFSQMFETDHDAMLEHLEQGNVGETIEEFFKQSDSFQPAKNSKLTLKEVDDWLEKLAELTKEDEQIVHFKKVAKKCTAGDLRTIVCLIKHDLRMNAGAKHILEGVHSDAYKAFQATRDINLVIKRCLGKESVKNTIQVMTPVLPMLAEACKSVEQAMRKCPNGMYAEIKYDGERVQVHKQGDEFRYYSRSLKPVQAHKIATLKELLPEAFPHGEDLILDSEILMMDTETGKPLPFGTLGVHKKEEFAHAQVCLFVFDCIYFNGTVLTGRTLKERKEVLKEHMIEIPNRIVFSEMQEINDKRDLGEMIAKVLQLGLEGLVLKDVCSVYEPGKRHWLKVKKDYLFDGAMADSADLLVLGAWYGSGKKGGMMSVFLMGCYDEEGDRFCTVTKVHTGHDDRTLERLQDELEMVKIGGNAGRVPKWLQCTKTMVPDFVAKEPRRQPVWEITGAEFSQAEVHTADGISIRFPRVTKIRDEKTWESATSLSELKRLYKTSKESTDVSLLLKKGEKRGNEDEEASESPKKKVKAEKEVNVEKKDKKTDKKEKKTETKEKKKGKDEKKMNEEENYLEGLVFGATEEVEDKAASLIAKVVEVGGEFLSEKEKCDNDIEYFVHAKTTVKKDVFNCKRHVKHVTLKWLKACVEEKSICDYIPYVVVLESQ